MMAAAAGKSDNPDPPSAGERGGIPPGLLEKLKLLPLRERELSTLRQQHQHQLRWLEATGELMVRLTHASTTAEAEEALLKSLVQEFGFDISGSSTPGSALEGDPVRDLTTTDRQFFDLVVGEVRRSKALVISQGEGLAGERALSWLMGGLAAMPDEKDQPVVIVGRTMRTAPYYPAPEKEETGLYRHLLSTVAQVLRAISLQATHNLELERKVVERTSELREAQNRVIRLEKEKVTEQMAGGFAHEMRNALSGAKMLIDEGTGVTGGEGSSLVDSTANELKALFMTARDSLDAEALARVRAHLSQIARNERMLDDILRGVDGALRRALSITTLLMDYSRIGYYPRGSEVVDVVALVKSILDGLSERLADQGIIPSVRASGFCPIRGSEAHLYSIFHNLVINAAEALQEVKDGRPRTLAIEVDHSATRAIVRVRDNANGIPPKIRARIFEPFFTTKPQSGTGLGLGMVQKLATLHDATVGVESEVGRGTTFVVSFSLAEDAQQRNPDAASIGRESGR
jgi:signal transduction histidine kinase